MAKIRLHNMTFYGFHGVSTAERETGCRVEVDCELDLDISSPACSDRLEDTINYTAVYATVEEIVQKNKFRLLETLVTRIAAKIESDFPARRIIVRVRKRIPPIPGNLDYIELEYDTASDSVRHGTGSKHTDAS
jgi:dihydroneopterin aldolase